jgi:hypothetical protein
MRITKRHLRKIIFETAPTFGLRTGDIVRHKDEEWRGTGKVVAKGSTRSRSISVIWSDGSRQRHDPSSLVKESKMRSAKQVQDDRQNAIRGLIKKGKGAEFETEEITAGRVRSNDDMILERWQKLAGIL